MGEIVVTAEDLAIPASMDLFCADPTKEVTPLEQRIDGVCIYCRLPRTECAKTSK